MFSTKNHSTISAQKAKYPITFGEMRIASEEWRDLSEFEDSPGSTFDLATPKGDWTSPVVREAMSRQVSKEIQIKCVWKKICNFFCVTFVLLAMEKLLKFYHPNLRVPEELLRENSILGVIFMKISDAGEYILEMFCLHGRRSLWVFAGFICLDLIRLARPQDQCRDLPLTARQRELIGLEPLGDVEEKNTVNEDLTIPGKHRGNESSEPSRVPKYARINRLSESLKKRTSTINEEECGISLSDTIPERTNLIRS